MISRLPFLIFLYFFALHEAATAQFFNAGRLTFGDEHVKVVVARGVPPASGLFIVYTEAPLPIQEFDPQRLTPHKARSMFISFDPKLNSYSKLLLPGNREFQIQGSLTISLGHTRVALDPNPASPYCSVVSGDSIIGFAGTERILNLSGNELVALLEANQLQANRYKDVIYTYAIDADNKLMLNGKPFAGTRLGVTTQYDNPCTEQGSIVVTGTDLARLLVAKERKLLAPVLKELQHDPQRARTTGEFLVLSLNSDSIVVLDPISGKFGVIEEAKEIGNKVCAFSSMKIS